MTAAGLCLLLDACATGTPANFTYIEPTSLPAPASRVVVEAPPDEAQQQIVAGLRSTPLEIASIDPEGRFIVAEYHGEPEPHVDCGTLVNVPRSGSRTIGQEPAARGTTRLVTRDGSFTRSMRLDGRLVARLEPMAGGTAVRSEATYVVSKMIRRDGSDAWARETIAFSSGARGTFPKGTTCQPTGALERVMLAALDRGRDLPLARADEVPDSVAAAAPADDGAGVVVQPPQGRAPVLVEPLAEPAAAGGVADPELGALVASAVPEGSCGQVVVERASAERVVLQGVASDLFTMDSMVNAVDFNYPDLTVDNRIEVLPRGACEALRLTERYAQQAPAGGRLQVMNLRDGVLVEGEVVRLALGLPRTSSHVHLSYFQSDGSVAHMELETPWQLDPNVPWLVDTRHVVAPPYGREFILAVATEDPLFEEPRPAVEPADEFLPALENALSAGFDEPVVTACAILTTTERGGTAGQAGPIDGGPCVVPSGS